MMASSDDGLPIPQPPKHWLLGNLGEIDSSNNAGSMWRLADLYGEIFRLDLAGRRVVVCSSCELVNDLCDGERFEKPVSGALEQVRVLTKDGLFTAYPGEHNWGVAHRLLMPVFGPMGIRKMFGGMMDITSQMLLQWDRFGPDHELDAADTFTRLTFDMIGLCAFGYRFNNFYREDPHPFVTQMGDVLMEAGKRSNRLAIENKLRIFSAQQTAENVAAMHALCDEIIADRKAHPQPDLQDLLNPMLHGKDPKTGESMTEENIRYNMVTFLVAGHETTSGSLGFLFYHLLRNPSQYLAAQREVDEVLGDGPFEPKHLSQLFRIKYSIYETLRYMGPISIISKRALKSTETIAGKYKVEPSDTLLLNLRPFHHDPAVWGDDADEFKPERWLNGGAERLPKNCFKAFGDGDRACIGRGFAEQEMIMVVAMILQNFQLEMADSAYELWPKVTLTLKPGGFKIKARRRPDRTLNGNLGSSTIPRSQQPKGLASGKSNAQQHDLKPIAILYGSQAGTCQSYAEELKSNAARYGFDANVSTMDSATEHVPKDRPVIIITPSYEGKPADNARKFVTWLEGNVDPKMFEGVKYAVFGVGNSDWVNTYHKIPKLVDGLFEKLGATRFIDTGFVDVKEDIMGPWEQWTEVMWGTLCAASGSTKPSSGSFLQAEIKAPSFASHLGGREIGYATVKINKSLGGEEVGLPKKHMEVELPPEISYRAGDYLVVLPTNRVENAKRVWKRFNLIPDDDVVVTGTNKAFLSPESSISIFDLLMTRVELGTPASQKQIQALAEATPEPQRAKLSELSEDHVYKEKILVKRYTILDLLEDNRDCALPFSKYLDMLKPLTPRQYSISSSPLANIQFVEYGKGGSTQKLTASITYDVHDEPALSGHGTFHGVASSYLARQEVGERIRCFTRATNVNFHLPLDVKTPIIMVCAGTGIAPMRAFIQERAAIKSARGHDLGPAILYFGCRHHEKDFIYSAELQKWQAEGVVSVRPCFSKVAPEGSHTGQYVPDRIWEDRKELSTLFGLQGAKIFVCGSARKLGKSTAEMFKKIWMETNGGDEAAAEEWLEKVREERYVSDTFE